MPVLILFAVFITIGVVGGYAVYKTTMLLMKLFRKPQIRTIQAVPQLTYNR
jgi:hypothetical protein